MHFYTLAYHIYTIVQSTQTQILFNGQCQDDGCIYIQDAKSEVGHFNISVCYIQMFTLYQWKGEFT